MTQSAFACLFLLLVIVSAQEYSHDFGEDIFQYTRAAYCPEDVIKNWDCEPCTRHSKMQHVQAFYNDTDKAQGYCGYDPESNKVIIAIRGSVNTANYLNDLDYFKNTYSRCSGCGVHGGFYDTYLNLANNLLGCAYTLHSDYPDAPIFVTGHSLGAAQATFAALEIKQLIGAIGGLYNYGTPRVGNEAFANFVEKELAGLFLARIVRDKDTFTHTPTQTQGFVHYGNEVFYDENMKNYQVCGREDKKCANKYFWPVQWKLNHHLYYYDQCAGCTYEGCSNVI